nr:putative Ig domain-containing protein [Sinorhizobium meliloti]
MCRRDQDLLDSVRGPPRRYRAVITTYAHPCGDHRQWFCRPSWLSFNPSTRTFSGTPTSTNVGTISVRGTANDLGSLAASETFNIGFDDANGAPTAVADTGDATEKGGVLNGSGGAPATGNVFTREHRSGCRRHKDRHRRQRQRHGRHGVRGTGAELAGARVTDSGPRTSGKTHGAKVVTQDNVCNPT